MKLNPSQQSLIAAIKKHRGRVSHIAKEFKCERNVILHYIREDKECSELLAQVRQGYDDIVLNMAEDNIISLLEKCDSTATFFTLNTRGDKRGWVPKGANQISADDKVTLDRFAAAIALERSKSSPELLPSHSETQSDLAQQKATLDISQ